MPKTNGATVSFVEHHTFDDGSEDGSVQGITLLVLSADEWRKQGAPHDLTITAAPVKA